MLEKLGKKFCQWSEKFMPDPFLFALVLTLITFGLGMGLTGQSARQMMNHWHSGFWSLLTFSMQMCMILITGYALATTDEVKALLGKLASLPKNTAQAAVLISLVALISGYINWGLAVVVGALLAREVAQRGEERGISLHYPLLGAAGYMGLAVWHGGFSGSAPLKIAEEGHFYADEMGVIPVTETLFHPLNLTVAAFAFVGIPLLFYFLAPKDEESMVTFSDVSSGEDQSPPTSSPPPAKPSTPAEHLENSFLLSLLFSAAVLVYIGDIYRTRGFYLDLNLVNLIFLFLGLLLHKTPIRYVEAVSEGVKGCSGIILQFPFYAGIMGMMKGGDLSLVQIFAENIAASATSTTYPLFTFFSAGIVNIFVPSGGGQWGVQGAVIIESARSLDVPLNHAILAFCYGDQWTNLLQPFWALPLLGITGLKASQIMGYCMAVMVVGVFFFTGVLLIF